MLFFLIWYSEVPFVSGKVQFVLIPSTCKQYQVGLSFTGGNRLWYDSHRTADSWWDTDFVIYLESLHWLPWTKGSLASTARAAFLSVQPSLVANGLLIRKANKRLTLNPHVQHGNRCEAIAKPIKQLHREEYLHSPIISPNCLRYKHIFVLVSCHVILPNPKHLFI